MSVELRLLKDKETGMPFVPITHWDAVSGKPDMSTKADKVVNATIGNFAGLDVNGNLIDSGSKATDFATTSALTNGLSTKQDVLTAGDNIAIDSGGTISAIDTTYVASDFDVKDLADSTSLRAEWSGKQATSDNNLNTTNKILVGAINELLVRIETLETQLNNYIEVIEDGFYIVDENMNIGFYVDSSGAHSINLVEYQSVN